MAEQHFQCPVCGATVHITGEGINHDTRKLLEAATDPAQKIVVGICEKCGPVWTTQSDSSSSNLPITRGDEPATDASDEKPVGQ
jgi:hypothetical protein